MIGSQLHHFAQNIVIFFSSHHTDPSWFSVIISLISIKKKTVDAYVYIKFLVLNNKSSYEKKKILTALVVIFEFLKLYS